MADRLKSIFSGWAEILFLQGSLSGAILVAIIAGLHPRLAVAGLLAVAAAYGFACLIGMERGFLQAGYYIYNPLFVGMSLGYRLDLTPQTILFVLAAGVFTLVLTILLANLLVVSLKLPVLSLPFAVASTFAYLTMAKYAGVLAAAPEGPGWYTDLDWPLWLGGFFKSLGSLLFMPRVLVGLLFSLLILRYSRILFGLAVAGYYVGVGIRALLLGSLEQALVSGNSFNYPLIAMALGGVFLVPSVQSGVLALVAVAVSPLVLEPVVTLLGTYGLPPFTLPFCFVTLGALYALRSVHYPLMSTGIGGTPEEVREHSLVNRLRYPGSLRTLSLPFAGRWTVWQAFNGRWTHQGVWRYAYDFVITDDEGQTHRGDGSRLEDYYCYRLPVLSPISGRVVRVIDKLPDNPVGTVRGGNNWGNLVILHDTRGFYVELSHFAPQSIRVKEGEWVERGAIVGLCGNSGFSPQPHIHLQAQVSDSLGAATLPFSFVSYCAGEQYEANSLPSEKAQVEPLFGDRHLSDVTSFVLDDRHEYAVYRAGKPVERFALHVKIAVDGTHYFETNRGRLYFGQHDGTFYTYRVEGDDPYLRQLFLALPRLPLAYKQRLAWSDYVPLRVAGSGLRRRLAGLAAFLWPQLSGVRVHQRFVGRQTIASVIESRVLGLHATGRVELDGQSGFASVAIGEWEWRKTAAQHYAVRLPQPAAARAPATTAVRVRYALAGLVGLAVIAVASALVTSSHRTPPTRPAVQRSVEYERANEYAQAIATLQEALAAHPNHYTLNLRLGWLSYLNGQHAAAVRYYQTAIAVAPQSREAKLAYLLPLLADGQYEVAEATATEILAEDPGNYYGNLRLAIAQRMQQKFADAEAVLRRMVAAHPADALFLAEQAALRAATPGRESAADARPAQNAECLAAVTVSAEQEKNQDYQSAIQTILARYEAQPQDYTFHVRLGWLYYLTGDYEAAVKYYDAAIQLAPSATEPKLGRLLPLLAAARYADAQAAAEPIVQADPGNYYGNLRLAFALRMQGQFAAAERIVRRMLRAYPADIQFLLESALLDVAQNRSASAQETFAEVLSLDPTNAVAKQQAAQL